MPKRKLEENIQNRPQTLFTYFSKLPKIGPNDNVQADRSQQETPLSPIENTSEPQSDQGLASNSDQKVENPKPSDEKRPFQSTV